MAKTHLDTAYDAGVQAALETEGYKSASDLERDAQELGILQQGAPTPEKVATSDADAIAELKSKLGK